MSANGDGADPTELYAQKANRQSGGKGTVDGHWLTAPDRWLVLRRDLGEMIFGSCGSRKQYMLAAGTLRGWGDGATAHDT